ncbi:flagellin domain-containing protein [Nitrosomonas sp.]|uniref:flagellin domain-containing protein n=1 Tax=Nitrosomonas sp. TaxID=42353 RepID=UPI0025EEEDE2|nr:flagellin domain-containing protein [Nitrosomonas sp.]MBE7527764.1 flagellin FliC [Burkholderiales bacterium]
MPQVINTNVASLNAQRNLNSSQSALSTSLSRLSSGLRINSAKDDAAGLAISERMTAQIRGLNQAARNANDGISLAQTAEGAMVEVTNNLQRIRELAVQASNDTNTDDDRNALQAEVKQLKLEIKRVAEQTKFNGTALLDGTFTSKNFQVGANNAETISIDNIVNIDKDTTDDTTGAIADDSPTSTLTTTSVNFSDLKVSTFAEAQTTLTAVDDALQIVNSSRANLGAIQNRFSSAIASLQTTSENLSASRSRIQDADFAAETAAMTRAQILQQAGVAMLSQANALPNNVLSLLR